MNKQLGRADRPTFVTAVDVPDLRPAVFDNNISQSSRVLRSDVELVGDLLTTGVHRHARRDERHAERGAVRLDRVERVGHVSGVECVYTARHHLAYCSNTALQRRIQELASSSNLN